MSCTRFCLAVLLVVEWGGIARAETLGDSTVTNYGIVDLWPSNLAIDEFRPYQNASAVAETVTVTTFQFAVGSNRSRVTPFVVWFRDLNENGDFTDDNIFTVMKIGTTRVSGIDYNATGVFRFEFDEDGPATFLLEPGETIGAGFIDANPNGTGGQAGSVIPFQQPAVPTGTHWYSGSISNTHPSPPSPLGESLSFGGPPNGYDRRNYEFNIEISAEPIPEPSTLALLAVGAFGLLAYAWRKRNWA
ncbi:MAG: PEP-CTERM sorting domain-containing protein [Candidatus Nealsonbacteria bacterium]|nr:PEP-CTERM sorting domain-containing protein [Candidatus Nealsonbacteria bacterium]